MQGDWWSSANFPQSKDAQQSSNQTTWESAVATPSVVNLTVHPFSESSPSGPPNRSGTGPLAVGGHPPRHWPCNNRSSTFGVASSASHLILAAQRRKRLHFNQQKTQAYLHSNRFGSQPDIIEPDLTWTSFFEHRRTHAGSSNSTPTYSTNQDGVQSSSPGVSSSGGQGSDISRQMSSEDLKHFERKLEREREKRIHTEPPPPRLDGRGVGENAPQFELNNMRRNGFRPTSKNSFMRDQPNVHLAAFRHGHAPPPPPIVDPMASLSITSTGAPTTLSSNPGIPGALRGMSIGFGNREAGGGGVIGSTAGSQGRSSNMKTRTRAAFLAGQNDKFKQNQYQFHDPGAGATPDFTQRLAELTSLESDTIRYERTKKAKKKSKQDSG